MEDIRLARLVKSENLKIAVLLGNRDVFCRMYRFWDEAILGFSRNIHEYFGGSLPVLIGFWFFVFWGPVIVGTVLGLNFLGLFVILVVLNRLLVALDSRQSVFWSVMLHPAQMIGFSAIVFYHIYRRFKKDTEWKGRRITF